jgi:hypothetical protein
MLRKAAARRGRRLRSLLLPAVLLIVGVAAYAARGAGRAELYRAPQNDPAEDVFVYSSEEPGLTLYWLAHADKPSLRTFIQEVPHAPGWSGAASVSPDGRSLVYTRLPRGQQGTESAAELWWLRLGGQRPVQLAADVDLRSTLVWSLSGSSVTFERITDGRAQLWRIPLAGGAAELLVDPPEGSAVIPVGYDATGEGLLAGRYDIHGTDLVRIARPGALETLEHLSDKTARGLTLSSRGSRLGFLAPDASLGPPTMRGTIVDLSTTTMSALPDSWGEIAGVAWQPNGRLSAGSTGEAKGLRDATGELLLPWPESGFLQPLAWSPSGRHLAARVFSGDSAADPGTAADVIIKPNATTSSVAGGAKERFIGWARSAPMARGGQEDSAPAAAASHSSTCYPISSAQPPLADIDDAFVRAGSGTLNVDPQLAMAPEHNGAGGLVQPPYIPPTVLRAIGWVESGWRQATYAVPRGQFGPTIASSTCAYGLMQLASGMSIDATPTPLQQQIGSDFRANISAAAQLLTKNWNRDPSALPYVGQHDPHIIEDWYFPIWAFHCFGAGCAGYSIHDNPDDPSLPWPRPTYNSPEQIASAASLDTSAYPYQELVYGLVLNPPQVEGHALWHSIAVQLPPHGGVGFPTPQAAGEPSAHLEDGSLVPPPVVLSR